MRESVNIALSHTPVYRIFSWRAWLSTMLRSLLLLLSLILPLSVATSATPPVLWAWGDGLNGLLGNGSAYRVNAIPMRTFISSDVTVISGGLYHSLALKSDGTVWAWGGGIHGELGNGLTANQRLPVQVAGLSNVIAIAGGGKHSLALKSDGTVWAWGDGYYGQLGDGGYSYLHFKTTPVQVTGLSNVIAIAAGHDYSLALKSDGTVWGWGHDDFGQLGVGVSSWLHLILSPVQVMNLTNVIAIASGSHHSLALKSDGTVWAWGWGNVGQIGNGTMPWVQPLPVQVTGLSNIVAISSRGLHSLALKPDGTVWAWGHGAYSQLGNGSVANQSMPVQVTGLSNVNSIAAGAYYSLALKPDGSVWAWGRSNYGQLGNGFTIDQSTPVRVSGLTNAISIASGGWHALALADPRVCVSPPSGMISWWDGDAVSGTTVSDIAGGHDGALINGATTAPGLVGDAFDLNGYNYVSAPFVYTGPFTVDFWAKPAMTSPDQSFGFAGLFSSGNPGHYDPFSQIDFDGAGNYRFHAGNNALHLNMGAVAPYWGSSLYQHLAVTYDGSMVRTYLNGALQDSGIWAGAPLQFEVVKIGLNRDHSGLFRGFIDEVEIFDRALTAAEIHSIYNAVEQGKCKGPVNQPPMANAGAAQVLECTGASSASVMLDGSLSSDPDGDTLIYTWSGPFGTVTGMNPAVSMPLGANQTVMLSVDDGNGHTATSDMLITVQDTDPPTVSAGPDVTLEATGTNGEDYDVSAQASASDSCCGVTLTAPAMAIYSLGPTTVSVSAVDCAGNSASDQMVVTVVDTTPPTMTAQLIPIPQPAEDEDKDKDDGEYYGEGSFKVMFTVSDIADANPTVVAMLNGQAVSNGQIVKLERDDEAKVEFEHGQLEIEGMNFTLNILATDASGNTGSATAAYVFPPRQAHHGDKHHKSKKHDKDD